MKFPLHNCTSYMQGIYFVMASLWNRFHALNANMYLWQVIITYSDKDFNNSAIKLFIIEAHLRSVIVYQPFSKSSIEYLLHDTQPRIVIYASRPQSACLRTKQDLQYFMASARKLLFSDSSITIQRVSTVKKLLFHRSNGFYRSCRFCGL